MRAHRSPDDESADGPPQRPIEETARLGDAIYENTVRARVEREHHGEVVAIDVDSGDYVVAEDALTASRRLRVRRPNADVWLVRVGFRALDRIGAGDVRGDR
ncbi:MAG: hypothetical protein ACRDJE_01715 [Dehalococcoidia bacterium]